MAAHPKGGPVTVLWDYENCPAPAADRLYIDGTTLVSRLCTEFLKFGPIVEVKTFGNVSTIRAAMREELQTSAVTVIDAQAVDKRKDLVDKMIFTHMFCFALDHPPPATIILISGDVDYALPLAMLKLRKYHIVLVKPSGRNVNSKLLGVAHEIYDWEDLLFPERLNSDTTDAGHIAAPHPNSAVIPPSVVPHPAVTKDSPAEAKPKLKHISHLSPQPPRPASSLPPSDCSNDSPPQPLSPAVQHPLGTATKAPKEHARDHKSERDGSKEKNDRDRENREKNRHSMELGAPSTPPKQGAIPTHHTPSSPFTAEQSQPAHLHSESDTDGSDDEAASSLSDALARIHLRNFIYVLVELHKLGDHQPLLTKVGSRLRERYPKLFKKGTSDDNFLLFFGLGTGTRLAKEAENAGLVQVYGHHPQRRLKYVPEKLFDFLETND